MAKLTRRHKSFQNLRAEMNPSWRSARLREAGATASAQLRAAKRKIAEYASDAREVRPIRWRQRVPQ